MPFISGRSTFQRITGALARKPNAPTITGSSAGNGTLDITFTAPYNGGLPITGYEYSINGGTTWAATDAGTTSPRRISGLTNGTDYTILLRAVNALGASVASNSFNDSVGLSTTPFTVPSKPAAPTVSIGTGATTTDTFSWLAPSNNGRAITKYQYEVYNGATLVSSGEKTTLTHGIQTAYTSASYKLKVRAVNAAGAGAYSELSTDGTGAWAFGSMTDQQSCTCSRGCPCGACTCGTNSGSQTAPGTQYRTCYRWTRSGSNSGPLRNPEDTGECSTSYGGCTDCGTYNDCTSCSGCTAESYITTAGTYNGTYYIPTFDYLGNVYMQVNALDTCGACYENMYEIWYCSVPPAKYRIVDVGCRCFGGPKCSC